MMSLDSMDDRWDSLRKVNIIKRPFLRWGSESRMVWNVGGRSPSVAGPTYRARVGMLKWRITAWKVREVC